MSCLQRVTASLALVLVVSTSSVAAQGLLVDDFEACCDLNPARWAVTSGWERRFNTNCEGSNQASNTSLVAGELRSIPLSIPASGGMVSWDYDSFSATTTLEVRPAAGVFSVVDTAAPTAGACEPRQVSLDAYAGQTIELRWVKEAGSSDYARIDRVSVRGRGLPCPNGSVFTDDFASGSLQPANWPVNDGVFVSGFGACTGNDMAQLSSGDSMQTRDLDLSCATRAQVTFTFSFSGVLPPEMHLHHDGGAGNPEYWSVWRGYDTGGACQTVTVELSDYVGSGATRLEFSQVGTDVFSIDDIDVSAWSNTGMTESFDGSLSLPAGWTATDPVAVTVIASGSAQSPGHEVSIDGSFESLTSPAISTAGASSFLVKLQLRSTDISTSAVVVEFLDSGGTWQQVTSVPAQELNSNHRYFRWSVTPDGLASGNIDDAARFFHAGFQLRVTSGFLNFDPVYVDTVVVTTAPHVRSGFSWWDGPGYLPDAEEDGRGCAVFAPGTLLEGPGLPNWPEALDDDFCFTDFSGSPAVLFGAITHSDVSRFIGIGQSLVTYVADYADPSSPSEPPNAMLATVALSRDNRYTGPGYLIYGAAFIDDSPLLDIHPRVGEAMAYMFQGRGDEGLAFDETYWLAHQPVGAGPRPVRTFHQRTIEDEFFTTFPSWPDMLFEPDNLCADVSCGVPRPVADGGYFTASEPLRVAKDGASFALTWDVTTCTLSDDYNVYVGEIGDYAGIVDGRCDVGLSGLVSIDVTGPNHWFLMTGNNGACGVDISTFGRDSLGQERSFTGWDAACRQTGQDVSRTCP